MLIGHEDKVRAFQKLVKEGRLSHAYLFFGEAQTGKYTFARSFAHFLEQGMFAVSGAPLIDVQWCAPVDGTIGINAVRELRTFLSQTPLRSPRRLAVVNDAHLLTAEAQSAMLKIVEEPPPHSLIILIAHDPQVLFPPLLSRLAKVYFPRFSNAELAEALVKSFRVPAARAREVARRSFGRLGRALSLIQGVGGEKKERTFSDELEERILSLWERGAETHGSALAYLLDREMNVKRYNVNENLQRKAVRAHLSNR
ncbi:hypothetical protein COU12_02600 [Candidatus Jorgensenbacteria bacterium CG10_big_fil_rev_8_21_14_0_10_54_38]|uniref:DNA polymerase III subunit delta n=2 Tax=Candidatus Joergenseniibacteriota TaxID=1752739 RepID=A0A2M6WFK3_9BACT|nr:MAG: hypothetical protein COX26_00315 [Candidatus Jorgensenbacteria bacterium CG23_combo_of_CG06-09_8_20_14_all_54_14]PIT91559.1 MAG: hypothetical protein COU12_02600 [Candidatus Jorgensenbacteria bacterium CG10_big_fil_rev_8_21_14_0_10_54_38]